MKNQQGIVWAPLLIIIGAVVVAGFTTYFLIQNNNSAEPENTNVAVVSQENSNTNSSEIVNTNQAANNNASVNTNTNTVSNTNTTTDPTAGWKTYTDTTYGFSIKYPQDLTVVKPCGTTGTLVTFCVGFRDAEGKDITVFVHPSTDIVSEGWFSAVEITSDKNETINGIAWRRIATKGGQSANQADRLGQSAITTKNGQSFSVAMSYYADFDEMIANYNAMLPTIAFTN